MAIALRANIAIAAAAATPVTTPFTFPPNDWAAYELGAAVIGAPDEAAALQSAGAPPVIGFCAVWLLWRLRAGAQDGRDG